MNLVAKRNCGKCTACCVQLRINVVELKKPADISCEHLCKTGCKIYEHRPTVCRNWYCGWRILDFFDNSWRPDRINILLRFENNSLTFQPMSDPANTLTTRKVLQFIGGAISSGLSIKISIPTKQGFCNSLTEINTFMLSAVNSHDFNQMKSAMLNAIVFSANQKTDPLT